MHRQPMYTCIYFKDMIKVCDVVLQEHKDEIRLLFIIRKERVKRNQKRRGTRFVLASVFTKLYFIHENMPNMRPFKASSCYFSTLKEHLLNHLANYANMRHGDKSQE